MAATTPTGATESGSTVTIKTTAAHGLAVNQTVLIAGVGVAGYNGIYTVTSVPNATTFTYSNLTTGLAASGGGTASVVPTVNLGSIFTQPALGTFNHSAGIINLTGTLNNIGSTLTMDNTTGW